MKTIEGMVYTLRVGVLGLNFAQEVKQHLGVPVEENHLKPELLTHLLPVPTLTLNVREGGVEEEGGDRFIGIIQGWR